MEAALGLIGAGTVRAGVPTDLVPLVGERQAAPNDRALQYHIVAV